jgi:glycosyltransferase involved in cell wall biosynthesis
MDHKVAITTICLNEEKFAQRFMESHKDYVDAIYILDTGSTDNTVEILKDYGAHVTTGWTKPWRFDIPRNVAINLVPKEYDICVSVDLDEVFNPGLKDNILKVWQPDTTRLRYQYAWSTNPDGSPGTTFWYDKIFHRNHYRWVLPVHEVLCYSSPDGHEIQAWSNDIFLTHKPDPTKSRSSYLPLLELAHKENPKDDRTAHYLGREYMYYSKWDEAIEQLTRHLSMSTSTWKSERCASMRFIGRSYQGKGDLKTAEQWYLKACAEMSSEREPWYELSKNYHFQHNWPGLYFASKSCLAIKERPPTYICEPSAWGWEPYDLASLGAWNIGLKNEAIELAKEALRLNPSDERIKNNILIMEANL